MIKDFKTRLWTHFGIMAAIIVGTVFGWLFLRADIKREAAVIFQKRSDLVTRTKTIAQLGVLQKDAEKAKPMMEKMESVLPTMDGISVVKDAYEKIAAEKKVSFNWRFGEEVKSNGKAPGHISLEMVIQGKTTDIIAFLKQAEQEKYYLTIQSVNITNSGSQAVGSVTGILYFK